jgi:hypothetical protein
MCTRTLAIADPPRLLALAYVAGDECAAKHAAAALVVQRCKLQMEMYKHDLEQARAKAENVQWGIEAIEEYVTMDDSEVSCLSANQTSSSGVSQMWQQHPKHSDCTAAESGFQLHNSLDGVTELLTQLRVESSQDMVWLLPLV